VSNAPQDIEQITAVAADYIEGWYSGDTERMDRCLHTDLVKRIPLSDSGELGTVTKARMLELTAAGGGDAVDPDFETVVHQVSGEIATATVSSPEYVDLLQLARAKSGWKIVNVLFRNRD